MPCRGKQIPFEEEVEEVTNESTVDPRLMFLEALREQR